MATQTDSPAAKERLLRNFFHDRERVLVAFSGGVDSALLLFVGTRELGSACRGVIADSPSYPAFEKEQALRFARSFHLNIDIITTRELEDPRYNSNPANRCYYCKSELYDRLTEYARTRGYAAVVDGTNASDLRGHRPGFQAVTERGVLSPLQELGFTKKDVRGLARKLELPVWDKPSFACLASRFPTGTAIAADRLARVEECEQFLLEQGFAQFRVRWRGRGARVVLDQAGLERLGVPLSPGGQVKGDVPKTGESDTGIVVRPANQELWSQIEAFLLSRGFEKVELDGRPYTEEGLLSGT